MEPIQFESDVTKHRYFWKIEENTWLVQCDPDSKMQAYYVTVLPCAIVMYGDYDGVIVKPGISRTEQLIPWMAGADSINYFAEKVCMGNRFHQVKVWDPEKAKRDLIKEIKDQEYKLRDFHDDEIYEGTIYEKETQAIHQILWNGAAAHEYQVPLSLLLNIIEDVDFENGFSFKDSLDRLEDETGLHVEMEEDIGEAYTRQIRWQHRLLLWWANVLRNPEAYDVEFFDDQKGWRTLHNGVSYRWGPNDRDDRYVEIQRPEGGLAMVSESQLICGFLRDVDRQLSEENEEAHNEE